ncbi:MAG TPA: ROK family protein [Terriglobales bacterium]|nr:ROK family protein [Terriglobales bacterium]
MLVGVDIGGTKTAVILAEDPSHILFREEFPTLPKLGPEHALAKINELIELALKRHSSGKSLQIGVSCGAPLDPVAGIIQSPPNLPTWVEVPIKDILEKRFGAPCLLENDANAGAVAEHRYGAGAGCTNLVFLTLGTGIGAGLILNGELYRGSTNMAGEVGHVTLTEGGPVGYGKAGSVEGWASGWGMALHGVDVVKAAQQAGEPTVLAEVAASGQLTSKDIGLAAMNGDAVARRIVKNTGERLGQALAILVDILNPERIVIGGLALRLGSLLFEPALAEMNRHALPQSAQCCTVLPAQLGERIGDVAALCVADGLSRSATSLDV